MFVANTATKINNDTTLRNKNPTTAIEVQQKKDKNWFSDKCSYANLCGFQSSSHTSDPIHVSSVDRTTSPNGTVI